MFIFGGLSGLYASPQLRISNFDVLEFFVFFHVGFTFTGVLILGFYFGEIASLTSAQSVPGLSKMKIPAAVFIIVLWAVVISEGIVNTVDATFQTANGGNLLQEFYFAWLGVVVPFACTAVLLWGSISLLLAMRGGGNTGAILRVSLLAVAIVVFYWAFGLVGFLFFFAPGLNAFVFFGPFTLQELSGLRALFFLLGFGLINICMTLAFSVSTEKEIEVSKSGTSSTSGSSGASSSSSSSSADPVIEL